MDWEFGVGRCELLYLEWISHRVLLKSTRNYIQALGLEENGKWYEKKTLYICMSGLHCCTAEYEGTL